MVYFAQGFSALSIQLESAPDSNGSPGTWVAFAGTVIDGSNPSTNTAGAATRAAGYYPWNRVRLASVTGAGKVQGVLYGCRAPGCSPLTKLASGICPNGPANSVQKSNGSICAPSSITDDGVTVSTPEPVLVGSADALIPSNLATPAAPTLVASGGTGTTWGYRVIATNQVGWTVGSTQATVSGPATLNGGGNNVAVTTAAEVNSTACLVFRTSAGGTPSATGYIGSVACGATVTDTGQAVSLLYPYQDDNFTTGGYVSRRLHVPFSGDNLGADLYVGSDPQAFTFPLGSTYLYGDQAQYAFHGTSVNRFSNIQAVIETTDTAQVSLQGLSATTGTGVPVGIQGQVLNTGSNLLANAWGIQGQVLRAVGSGNITLAAGFHAADTLAISTGSGAVTSYAGYHVGAITGAGTLYGYYAGLTANVNRWGYYNASTAANRPGDTTFSSLLAYGDGAEVDCANCTVTSSVDDTCADDSSGATPPTVHARAKRINGVWRCAI